MRARARYGYQSLIQRDEWQYDIIDYGDNNLYPDVMRELLEQCALADSCRNKLADFVSGDGIANANIAQMVVNTKGQTMADILEFCAYEFETFNGFALHLQKNILGKVTEITPVPFQYCRVTTDRVRIAVSDNWHGESTDVFSFIEPIYYPLHKREGIHDVLNNSGCIFYYADTKNSNSPYPYNPAHAIVKAIKTDILLSGMQFSSAKNNFSATTIITTPTDYTVEQENIMRAQIQNAQGEEGGGKVIFLKGLVRDADGNWVSPYKIETITPASIDKLHEGTSLRVEKQILQKYDVPAELASARQGSSLNISPDGIKTAYQYMNNITKMRRDVIARQLSAILGMKIEILPKKFIE